MLEVDDVLYRVDMEYVDEMQMVACFMYRYVIGHYGNLIFLNRVERHSEDGWFKKYVGHLSCGSSEKDGHGGWKVVRPRMDVGSIEVDMFLNVIWASSREDVQYGISMIDCLWMMRGKE